MFSWRKRRKIFRTGTRQNNCLYHKHSRKTSGENFGAQIKARHLQQNQNNYRAMYMYMYTWVPVLIFMFSRDECKITFSFREKPKCLTRAYVFNLVCISHVQFCCFGEPRGKVEEHLLNGNLQPNYTTNKKKILRLGNLWPSELNCLLVKAYSRLSGWPCVLTGFSPTGYVSYGW